MDQAQNAVENNQVAAAGGVETKATVAPVAPTLAEHEALIAELAKAKEERENYRRGMLAAKGKPVKDPVDEESDLDTLVQQKVVQALEAEKEALVNKKYEAVVETLMLKNKEYALALQNKANMPNASAGTGQVDKAVSDNFFSAEQLADLKKRGLDPEKVKANLLRKK